MVRLYKSDVPKFPLLNGYSFNNFGNSSTKTNLLILCAMNFCIAVLGAEILTHISFTKVFKDSKVRKLGLKTHLPAMNIQAKLSTRWAPDPVICGVITPI